MPDVWLPGYERIEIPGCAGRSEGQVGNWSVTLHTMQGSMNGGISWFRQKPCYCPQISADLAAERAVQHIRLDQSAAALANLPGGVETNRAREIQIEIAGYAEDSPKRTDRELAFLGRIIADIARAGYPIDLHTELPFYGPGCGWVLASRTARQRMTPAQWYAFRGVGGHQHAPENDHWDPGALDIATVLRHARNLLAGDATRQTTTAPATPTAKPYPGLLRRGSTGEPVRVLQQALTAKRYTLTIDGDFGPRTETAVRAFQTAIRVAVDGIVGPVTWAALWR